MLTHAQFNDPANPQTNDPVNAQANDFHASSIMQQDPLIGASSGQMHEYLAEDDQDDTRHLSPGWHSDNDGIQHILVSDRFHSTPMGDPFSSTNGNTENYYPMDSPGFQNPDIGYTNALNLNMDFTGQDGEFDEFAIDSDPLFMDLDVDPNPQQAGSFLEQTNIFQENLPQAPQNSARLVGPLSSTNEFISTGHRLSFPISDLPIFGSTSFNICRPVIAGSQVWKRW